MDTFDSPRSSVPARLSSQRSISPPASRFGATQPDAAPSVISIKVAFRGACRYWWLVLALTTVGTAGLGAVIYLKVHPSYQAISLIRIESSAMEIYGFKDNEGLEPFMQTQVQMITSPNVLSAAANNPNVAKLARIQESGDPVIELRKSVQVMIKPGTFLIEVSMSSPSASESATIVNAVVDAYMASNVEWSTGMTRNQITALEKYLSDLKNQSADLERKWKLLVKQSTHGGQVVELKAPSGPGKTGEAVPTVVQSNMAVEQLRAQQKEFFDNKIALMQAEARLADLKRPSGGPAKVEVAADDFAQTRDRDAARFRAEPEVKALTAKMNEIKAKYDEATRKTRDLRDPGILVIQRKMDALQDQWNALWTEKTQQYHDMGTGGGMTVADNAQAISDTAMKIQELTIKQKVLKEELDKLQITTKNDEYNDVEIALVKESRASLLDMQTVVDRRLQQLKFEANGEERIRPMNVALAPNRPISDKRIQFLAITPFAVLGAVLGLVVLLEIKSGRVGDTDLLSSRVRNEVFAIAPLPELRAGDDPNDLKSEQKLARFVQSLDHLRVALCEGGIPGEGRCVMITSATGGEGKTTLSAHLAARCANAGTSTLLIDADMRRASLGRLLDVPVGLGLGDVLGGEADLDASLITVQAGGFHFLSAGTPGRDPSRVLKSSRLAELIGRLRQTYDLIIIDTPPVLPVADALIMGRWADGAVMAARYDASRLPLVERANRQLAVAGIPVLGVVVNGVRGHATNYGSYAYSYNYLGRSEGSDPNPS